MDFKDDMSICDSSAGEDEDSQFLDESESVYESSYYDHTGDIDVECNFAYVAFARVEPFSV